MKTSFVQISFIFLLALIFCAPARSFAEETSSKSIAVKGELLFSDDFEKAESIENWISVIPTFTVKNGVLVGSQTRDDHGAVGRVPIPFKDCIIEFKFRFEGSIAINAVIDDKNFKGSHAGHICRVALTPNQIRLGDDKEGIMRNDIFAMRRAPKRKSEANKLLEGRGLMVRQTLEQNKWYHLRIELVDDTMRVSLDNKAIGLLKSPGLAHKTKTSFHFTVRGKDAHFDNVKIWAAKKK